MERKSIVEIKDISMTYHTLDGETEAIKDINLNIDKGEIVSLVGPSGCGKSTLLSIIAGLIEPSKGKVLIKGKEVKGPTKEIGYMFQRDHLFEWRTIIENVLIGLEIQGKVNEENYKYAEKLLDIYGLSDFKEKFPRQLSGGMRQRAALIRTLVVKPDLLLLDEPFSALDYQTRLAIADEIGIILKKEEKTALMVTHDIAEAISMADRVIVLSKRPATIKDIIPINLSCPGGVRTPMKCREAPEFRHYFNQIWKELDIHV
ncbi:ABC transporter ATP-binding protein [Anaerosalibacter bizertensis]|uniref:ABC transporter ATP-binding protein n=1 Tax=Anaerosalibacter bizertensis TaxID=932217 RepID=A0A9Q4AAZ1_9FIRM|nr:ABC transporter ATP-binding protein [Anaerosalibacter bizertensis]MBV1821762.1 ABC transporter ATP-binding protein [Bacteroidales bacterium MSK.15.36]HHV26448.1 ABC transporter ATP-binding protein [Tissierellia bacterium]MBU5294539.1 ABC transporter ATP-binding protein [Anaerosalibacter bizertensis]MCG4564538.1 ABC transporter ATP-binding protein [Anaerosalibacter bizertensis]MCG4581741.1 ABC transporter ATP-binding protein [Anaerosalibacter bizertensis]